MIRHLGIEQRVRSSVKAHKRTPMLQVKTPLGKLRGIRMIVENSPAEFMKGVAACRNTSLPFAASCRCSCLQ